MTASLPPMIKFQPLVAGLPLPGGKVTFYQAGTTTLQAAYAADGTTPLANPLDLDANGSTTFRLGTGLSYKINLTDALGAQVVNWPQDNISGIDGIFTDFSSTATGKGDALIGVKSDLTGGKDRTQHEKNADALYSSDFTGASATAILQSAITAAVTAGKNLIINSGAYSIIDNLNVTGPVVIEGEPGAVITQTVDGKNVFAVTGNRVTILGLKLIGTGSPTTKVDNCTAIQADGTSGAQIYGLRIFNNEITNWKDSGIRTDFVYDADIAHNNIHGITYAGISCASLVSSRIHHNFVDDIKCDLGSSGNGYGITVTQNDLLIANRSTRVSIDHNNVSNVVTWEGIDTHGGLDIIIDANTVNGCLYGVVATTVVNGASTISPHRVNITKNVIDSGATDGSKASGIQFFGYDGVSPYVSGTGMISGNIIQDHGKTTDDDSDGAAIAVGSTKGLVIKGNAIRGGGPYGVMLRSANVAFSVEGNAILDLWSNTYNVVGINLKLTGNTSGYIGDNHISQLTATGTYILTTAGAIGVNVPASNSTVLGFNAGNANIPVSDPSLNTTLSFYTAAPTAQLLLATGTGKTVDNVITALQTLGLVRQT